MSQEALAERLSLTRSKLSALENGQTRAPQPEDLVACSEFFGISIDSLLKIDLTTLGELKLRELEAGNDVYMTGSRVRVLAITVNNENRENIEYVPVKAKAGYRSGYNDPQYIAELPKFNIPNLPHGSTYRIFPTTGDSMQPIPEGSDIVAKYVEDWTSLKPDSPCIVILKGEQDFVFKQVTVGKGKILLKSYNDLYVPYEVEAGEVLEIWKLVKYLTDEIPEKTSGMRQLLEMVRDIKSSLEDKK